MDDYIEIACSCGKTLKVPKSRAGQTGRCARCKRPVEIPLLEEEEFISASGSSKSSKPKKKKKTKGKSLPGIKILKRFVVPLTIFTIGLFIGLFLGPGYLGVLPGANYFKGLFTSKDEGYKKDLKEDVKKELVEDISEKEKAKEFKEIDMSKTENKIGNKSDGNKKDTSIDDFDPAKREEIKNCVRTVERYINSLERETESLKEYVNVLSGERGINLTKANSLITAADKQIKIMRSYIVYANKMVEKSNWKTLEKLYERRMKNWSQYSPSTSSLISDIRETKNSLKNRSKDFSKLSRSSEVDSEYMGKWYKDLSPLLYKLENLLEKNYSASSSGTYHRIHATKISIKQIKKLPSMVKQNAVNLSSCIAKGKNIKLWIDDRRKTALSADQKGQADQVEKFLKNGKKFVVELDGEIDELKSSIEDVESEIYEKTVNDATIRKILKTLKKIERQYERPYKNFNSAVINLQFQQRLWL